MTALVSLKQIKQTILIIRGHRVMLDTDLTDLYADLHGEGCAGRKLRPAQETQVLSWSPHT
jgi:hypothetical protein